MLFTKAMRAMLVGRQGHWFFKSRIWMKFYFQNSDKTLNIREMWLTGRVTGSYANGEHPRAIKPNSGPFVKFVSEETELLGE